MKKQIFGLALAAAWMGSNTVWAQAPVTPAAPTAPAAPTSPTAAPEAPIIPAAPRRGSQVQGRVTAVDMVKKTVTVTPRRSTDSAVLTLAPDAKVLLTQPAALSDLKTGNLIAAYGDLTPGATAVTATRLVVLPADTPQGRPGPRAGYHRTYVQGTVANTSPLTLTTAGGVTVTVTTAADTSVTKTVTGTTGGYHRPARTIQARTTGDTGSPTATEIRIMPANAARSQRPAAPAVRRSAEIAPLART